MAMDRIKNFFSNFFRVSNIGTIAFFVINVLILFGLFSPVIEEDPAMGASLVMMYILSLAVTFSPIGQAVLCALNGAKQMMRSDMRSRVLPVVEEVYAAAKRKTPTLPDRINVRIMYDSNPNAFAIGLNTICVTEGMLEMPENLMAGVIAHEMGHLAMQHTVIQLLIGGGNLIMTGLMLALQFLCVIFGATSVATGARRDDDGVSWIAGFFALISAGIVFLWTKFCMLLLMGSSRANEYAADEYAFNIGYGDELAEALDRLTMGTPQATFLKMLSSSHPEPGDRIGKLQALGVSYSRY